MIVQDLVNNLAECIHKIKCKYENDDKKVKLAELNTNIATFFFKRWFNIIKMFMLQQEISKKFDEIIYKFSNHDINMFILLLQKVSTHMNIRTIAKSSMKHLHLEKKIFTVT